jgi:lysyl endopeptidase
MKSFSPGLSALLLLVANSLYGQISFGGEPYAFREPDVLPEAQLVVLPAVDVEALMAEDDERAAQGIKGPWRFGYNHLVDLGLDNSGTWHTLQNGDRVWRLAVESPGAYSINLEFHDFVIPEGAVVFIYNEMGEHLGGYEAGSAIGQTVLGVTQIAGERITIEYYEPASVSGQGSLRVGQITHAYRDVLGQMRGLGDSGSCNRNVICPQGDNWRDQIRSVAMITVGGSGMCTGQLINNCNNNGTPYFLTANHCLGGNLNSWVFRFNWESPVCNANQNGPTNQTVSGAALRANSTTTDVALLQLNTTPPAAYNVFYSGWDRSSTPAQNVTAIHHPSGDIKKISHEQQPVTAIALVQNGPLNYWRVAGWDDGTTEGGSSGSGLWNQNGLLVGQLYGGQASCSFNFNDYYGRFDLSYPLLQQWLGDCGMQLQGYPLSTGVEDRSAAGGMELYPNPSTGTTTLKLPAPSSGPLQLRVFDTTGRLVHGSLLAGGIVQHDMDLRQLPEGLYVVDVNGEGFHTSVRLVLGR